MKAIMEIEKKEKNIVSNKIKNQKNI